MSRQELTPSIIVPPMFELRYRAEDEGDELLTLPWQFNIAALRDTDLAEFFSNTNIANERRVELAGGWELIWLMRTGKKDTSFLNLHRETDRVIADRSMRFTPGGRLQLLEVSQRDPRINLASTNYYRTIRIARAPLGSIAIREVDHVGLLSVRNVLIEVNPDGDMRYDGIPANVAPEYTVTLNGMRPPIYPATGLSRIFENELRTLMD